MHTDDARPRVSHPAQRVAQWFVSAVKAVATALFKVLRWVFAWICRGVHWLLRHIYDWFMKLNGTAKILFALNIILLIMVIVLWFDLWSVFFGNQ